MQTDWNKSIDSYAVTNIGKVRKNNEDSILSLQEYGCFVVSDGMGGGNAGEVASQMIVSAIDSAIKKSSEIPGEREGAVINSVYKTNAGINDFAMAHHYSSMGATMVCFLLNPWYPTLSTVLHAGDSRLYRLRDDKLECLTEDHTVASASKISEGSLAPMFRGVLTNALGTGTDFFIERTSIDIQQNDVFILCSDGLSRMISDPEIQRICVPLSNETSKAYCQNLLDSALHNGGRDNISIVVVRIKKLCDKYQPSENEAQKDADAQIRNLMDLSDTPPTEVEHAVKTTQKK